MRDTVPQVLERLAWMREEGIWPNGLRYLWTDAFGLVLFVSLYEELGEQEWLDEAVRLVDEVDRVLGRTRGIRIGEAADRDGQYYHYLAMWLYALGRLGSILPEYTERGVRLVREIHRPFVMPGIGVHWKMEEDLSGPYPGYGLGALDAFDGYVSYRLLDQEALGQEIAEMRTLIEVSYRDLLVTQDLGLGMMLWLAHFFPHEPWAEVHMDRSLRVLDTLWVEPDGYFCRQPGHRDVKFAFTNYGISVGLQSVGAMPERIPRLEAFFDAYVSGDEYDRAAITHVMACSSLFPGQLLARP